MLQQIQKPSWQWGRYRGSLCWAPTVPQHHNQTSGKRRENTVSFFFYNSESQPEICCQVKKTIGGGGLFLLTDSSRKTSKRIIKPHSVLTSSQVSSWALLFVLSRVCLSDLRGHVYVMGGLCVRLLMQTTVWFHLQSLPPWKASSIHQGDPIASRVKGLTELTDQSQMGNIITNGLAFHRWCPPLIFLLSVGLPGETEGFQVVLHEEKNILF